MKHCLGCGVALTTANCYWSKNDNALISRCKKCKHKQRLEYRARVKIPKILPDDIEVDLPPNDDVSRAVYWQAQGIVFEPQSVENAKYVFPLS